MSYESYELSENSMVVIEVNEITKCRIFMRKVDESELFLMNYEKWFKDHVRSVVFKWIMEKKWLIMIKGNQKDFLKP